MVRCRHQPQNQDRFQIQNENELENFSETGALLSSVTDIESDYQFLTSGNHMVFYRVNGQDVYVDRVLYGRRDYLRILFPDLPQNDNEGKN